MREICLGLPHAAETLNWGSVLCFWVGEREIGGKMFAVTDAEGAGPHVLSYAAGPERYHELLETEGIVPAPHLARAHWVAMQRWDVLRPRELEEELRRAHAIVWAKLPKRVRDVLGLPAKERERAIRERKALVGERGKGR